MVIRFPKVFVRSLVAGAACLVLATPAARAVIPVSDVAKDPRDVPASPLGDVVVQLDAVEVLAEVAPGQQAWVWTFAEPGRRPTVPGPMIRVREGNRIILTLCNKLSNVEPHNIDFHAAMGPGGGAAVTSVEPNECKTLTFKALRQGAYIYHCAGEGMPWEHVAYGMYGLIQVDPPGGLTPGFSEFYVGQSDWYFRVDEGLNSDKGLPAGTWTLDEEKAFAEHPDLITFNGHQGALTSEALFGHAMHVAVGSKVRFFFVTGGPNIGSNFHVIGTIFDRVYAGSPRTPVENEETLHVPPGSAAVLELTAPVPGRYLLVDHALFRVPKGAAGFLHVALPPGCASVDQPGCWPTDIFSPPAAGTGH